MVRCGETPSPAGIRSDTQDFTSISDTGNFFDSPFFAETGFTPLHRPVSPPALLVLIGLAMLASLKGGAFRLPGAGQFILVVLGIIIAIVGVTNLASLYATGPGTEFLEPEYGLFILTAGALIGFFGVVGGAGKGDS